MTKLTPVAALLVCLLSTAHMCGSQPGIKPGEINTSCFTQESLKNVSWQKDQLAFFQRPRSGALRVVVSHYNNEYFLVYENLTVSSPMSYIFDCSGNSLGQRGINYNLFISQANDVVTLVTGTY